MIADLRGPIEHHASPRLLVLTVSFWALFFTPGAVCFWLVYRDLLPVIALVGISAFMALFAGLCALCMSLQVLLHRNESPEVPDPPRVRHSSGGPTAGEVLAFICGAIALIIGAIGLLR